MQEIFTETAVQQALTTKWLGRFYRYYAAIGSTNDALKKMVAAGDKDYPPAGAVLFTDFQHQGRGRLDRTWQAPPGTSLLVSLLLRPDWPAEQAHRVAMMVGLAAAKAIEAAANVRVGLKWPNDLMIERAGVWHKLGGILAEGVITANGRLESVVVGLGLNVNIPPEQLPTAAVPATSLLAATHQPVSRLALLVHFLAQLEMIYETRGQNRPLHLAWNQRLITLGQQVQVTYTQKSSLSEAIVGTAESTNEWGQLQVRDENGVLHTVTAGDVTLRQNR